MHTGPKPRPQDLDPNDQAEFDEPVRSDESPADELPEADFYGDDGFDEVADAGDFDERDDFDHEDRFADLDPSPYDGTLSEE